MPLEDIVRALVQNLSFILPRLGGAAIALLVGWAIGRLLGGIATKVARKVRIDETFGASTVGRALAGFNMTLSEFIGTCFKWFIYLGSVFVAIDLLGIPALERFSEAAIEYLPSLLGGVITLIAGMLVIEILAKILSESLAGMRVPYYRLAMVFVRFILYSIVLVMSLSIMKIDATVLNSLLSAIFWGTALGIGAAVGIAFGFGTKDYVAANIKTWLEAAEKAEKSQQIKEYEARIRRYEARIEELEKEIDRQKEIIKDLENRRRAEISEYEKVSSDLERELRELIKDAGDVVYAKGGYRIEVKDVSRFPLTRVVVFLASNGFKVSIEKGKEGYLLCARPKVRIA